MRKFKTSPFGDEVDLDDPETYSHLPSTTKELRKRMFEQVGYAFIYMDFFPDRKDMYPKRKKKEEFAPLTDWYPDADPTKMVEVNNCGYNQRQRVYKLIEEFAKNERANYDNVAWYREQVFLFENETENMC